ncbi:HET-domain-containing protein [Apiospora sp. TS-2023a]
MDTIANGYPGGPLDEKDSFRVIEIQPGERNEPVTVRLITTNLRDCSSYESLSYAWGDLTQTEPIQVVAARIGHDDSPKASLSVTTGCADALRRLRSDTTPRTLWVDSICINQSLIPERNQQLRLMSRIYSGASRVVIYLGESSGADGSDTVMDWLRELHEPSNAAAGHIPAPDLSVLHEFLDRRWFTRVWVLQEVRLARGATVVCGDREVSWDAFRELRDWKRNSRTFRGPHRVWTLPYAVQSLVTDVSGRFLPPYSARLLRLLVDTRDLGATDVRDKLFALLPLLAWEGNRHREARLAADTSDDDDDRPAADTSDDDDDQAGFVTLECDYERSPAEVFKQLARNLINAVGLQVLYCVATPTTISGLPSWVPDWGTKPRQTARRGAEQNRFLPRPLKHNIDTETSGSWHFSDYTTSHGEHGTQLHVQAASGGTIARLGELCDVYSNSFPLEQWEGLCDPVHLEDGPGDPSGSDPWRHRSSRFVRVLFQDRIPYEDVAAKAVEAIREYNLEKSGSRRSSPETTAELRRWQIKLGGDAKEETALVDIFQAMAPSYQRQTELVFQCCHARRLFVTDNGYLGLAPETARVGDRVMVIKGLEVPFVARRTEDAGDGGLEAVRLLGTCYREALSLKANGGEDTDHLMNYQERLIR